MWVKAADNSWKTPFQNVNNPFIRELKMLISFKIAFVVDNLAFYPHASSKLIHIFLLFISQCF